MDVLHITQTKNIKSIMKNGILRSKPLLHQYDTVMKKEYGAKYDKERGLVFCIPEGVSRRDKFIKDFFYWKTWGDDRNKFIYSRLDFFDDMQEEGSKVFSYIKPQSLCFSILLVDIPREELCNNYFHVQNNSMGSLWNDMDVRYEHDDKPLVLVNYDIKADNIKSVVGTGQSIVTKDNKINTLLQL